MKRITLRVLLFLLLGAVINIAVAWACTIWSPVASRNRPVPPTDWPTLFPDVTPKFDAPLDAYAIAEKHFGADFLIYSFTQSRSDVIHVLMTGTVCRAGFPFRAFVGVADSAFSPAGKSFQDAYLRSSRTRGSLHLRTPQFSGWTVPIRPIWTGTCANCAIFAITQWFLLDAAALARRIRRRCHGLCERCAYPIGPSPICPECGKPVQPRAAATHEADCPESVSATVKAD